MANIFVDDLVYSVVEFLRASEVTIKDLTGAEETTSGLLTDLFPNLTLLALDQHDLEELPIPSIGATVEAEFRSSRDFFDDCRLYEYTGRLLVVGSVPEEGEVDYDESIKQAMQLSNALGSLLKRDVELPWFAGTYDSIGTTETIGKLTLRHASPQRIDSHTFGVSFVLEVIA